jgi:DNA invertase Pin-like site-specific DNA recombinase
VVWKLDRLGRSSPHVLDIMTNLRDSSIAFWSLTEGMDASTPHGKLLFHICWALTIYEYAVSLYTMQAIPVNVH